MKVTIREPFDKAWEIFKWPVKCLGIGLDQKIVDKVADKNQSLEIDLLRTHQMYVAKASEIRKFAISNKWFYTVGKNTKLYVIPENLLRKVVL